MNFLSIVSYTVLNRLAGDGRWKRALNLPGRPIYYAAVAAFLVMCLSWGWVFSGMCALSFLLWRLPGWYNAIDAGTNTEAPLRDFLVMSARGLLLFPVFWFSNAWLLLGITCLLIGGIYHAAWHIKFLRFIPGNGIERAEILTGAMLGVVFSIMGGG